MASQKSNKEPANMGDAINNVRWCQHVQQAVFGKKRERNRKPEDDSTFCGTGNGEYQSNSTKNTKKSKFQSFRRICGNFD